MGGNVKIGVFKAEPWNISKTEFQRGSLVQLVTFFMADLALLYFTKYGKDLGNFEYAGSTAHLMNTKLHNIEHDFPLVNDIDIMLDKSVKSNILNLMNPGERIGLQTVCEIKKHGLQASILMRDIFQKIHQWDLVFVDDPQSVESRFLHSSDWDDRLCGYKGVHHKVLLNAIGLDEYKFSITHGLKSRDPNNSLQLMNPHDIFERLFPGGIKQGQAWKIWSFMGLVDLIRMYRSFEQQNLILEKFRKDISKIKNVDHTAALDYINGDH